MSNNQKDNSGDIPKCHICGKEYKAVDYGLNQAGDKVYKDEPDCDCGQEMPKGNKEKAIELLERAIKYQGKDPRSIDAQTLDLLDQSLALLKEQQPEASELSKKLMNNASLLMCQKKSIELFERLRRACTELDRLAELQKWYEGEIFRLEKAKQKYKEENKQKDITIRDLAMLIRRINLHRGVQSVQEKAMDYLKRKNLLGNIARSGQALSGQKGD